MTQGRRIALLLAGTAAAVAVATATAALPASYPASGFPESRVPTTYGPVQKRAGAQCTIGFSNPLAANEELSWRGRAIKARAAQLGCRVIELDAQLNVDKQIRDVNQMLVQKVGAIIVYPLDPKALGSLLARAKQQGVAVIGMDVTFGNRNAAAPGYLTQTWQGRDHESFLQVQQIARLHPGGKIVIIGIGAPVPSLKYWAQRVRYWAKQAGLTVLGQQDNPTDDAAGGEQAMSGLLGRYADIDAVIAYNDPSALGASAAIRAAGRTITAMGENGGSDGIEGVRSGRVAATLLHDVVGIGVQTVNAAYLAITKQRTTFPRVVLRKPLLVTKANVDRIEWWDKQVAKLR